MINYCASTNVPEVIDYVYAVQSVQPRVGLKSRIVNTEVIRYLVVDHKSCRHLFFCLLFNTCSNVIDGGCGDLTSAS